MAKILSPRTVFTETDQSQVFTRPETSDFLLISPLAKGEYFVPLRFENYSDFENYAGGINEEDYAGLAVKETLKDANSITVVGVAGTEDYSGSATENVFNIKVQSGSVTRSVATLYLTPRGIDESIDGITVTGTGSSFTLQPTSASVSISSSATLSLFKTDSNWIGNYNDPQSDVKLFYTKYWYDPVSIATSENSGNVFNTSDLSVTSASSALEYSGVASGRTPMVVSQQIGGSSEDLFYFETIKQGDGANREVKVSFENIRLASELNDPNAEYGLFDVVVRAYGDTDADQQVLERFADVNINPKSTDYIGKRIGTRKVVYSETNSQIEQTGLHDNRSSYIRVVEASSIKSVTKTAVPYGFDLYPLASDSFTGSSTPNYVVADNSGSVATSYGGVNFDDIEYADYLHSELQKVGEEFRVEPSTDGTTPYQVSATAIGSISETDRQFSVGFYGGTDGIAKSTKRLVGRNATSANTFGLDFSSTTTNGYLAYKKALDIIKDKDFLVCKYVSLAGLNLRQHAGVFNYAHSVAEENGIFTIISDAGAPQDTIATLETTTDGAFDTTHGATYAPWFTISEAVDGSLQTLEAPQGVLMLRTIAYNNRIGRPWYQPLGFERGIQSGNFPLQQFNSVAVRDRLYKARINVVARFAGEPTPIVLHGLTLQRKNTALSNVNVRFLLAESKAEIDIITRKYIGRPLTSAQRNQLASEISDYLSEVQAQNGLERFDVIFDETINTPDVVDQAIIKGVIYLVPIKGIRGFEIGFIIGNSGTTYAERAE